MSFGTATMKHAQLSHEHASLLSPSPYTIWMKLCDEPPNVCKQDLTEGAAEDTAHYFCTGTSALPVKKSLHEHAV